MSDTAGAIFESSIPGYPLIGRGKVRDIYSIDEEHLLIVTTDRLSAFDVVMPDPVPGKGEVLTQISLFWFRMMQEIIENQLTSRTIDDVVEDPALREQLRRRALVVKRLKPLPIESVVRGYLIGSGWKDYQETGGICGIQLPTGLRQADRLPEVLFTPSNKAAAGEHDDRRCRQCEAGGAECQAGFGVHSPPRVGDEGVGEADPANCPAGAVFPPVEPGRLKTVLRLP